MGKIRTKRFAVTYFCKHTAYEPFALGPGTAWVVRKRNEAAKSEFCPSCLASDQERRERMEERETVV